MTNNFLIPALIVLAVVVSGCTSTTNTTTTTTTTQAPQTTSTISTITGSATTTTTTTTQAGAKEFSITASQWKFEPNTINVNQGDTVKLQIRSIDVTHGFNLPAFGVNKQLDAGKTITVEFVADKKGTFTFSCSVFCGSGHSGMTGKLVVS